jgi:hypothetical protein
MDEGTLVDFDYSVRVVLSSSHLSNMKKPVLMLDLSLKYENGSTATKTIELNASDLDQASTQYQLSVVALVSYFVPSNASFLFVGRGGLHLPYSCQVLSSFANINSVLGN